MNQSLTIGTETKGVTTKPDLWTDERTARLRELYSEGYSATQIGMQLDCYLTRNAVCGKLFRLGLVGQKMVNPIRAALRAQRAKRAGERRKVQANRKKPSAPAPIVCEEMEPLHIGINDLTEKTCHWPFGDRAPYTYCGVRALEGLPYCWIHSGAAYQPGNRRGAE